MSLAAILNELKNPSWMQIPNTLIAFRDKIALSKKESNQVLETATTSVDDGDVQKAQNYLYLGLLLDESRFLADLQKNGTLRISRLSYVVEPLTTVVRSLLSVELGLSAIVTNYLNSVANLYGIARSVRREYQDLRDWLIKEKEVGVKTVLAWLDFTFLKNAVGVHNTNKLQYNSRQPYFFSIEELAEGFSSLLAIYGNEIGELQLNPSINESGCLDETYLKILFSSAHIPAFREWEFQVDRQGYRITQTDKLNEFKLVPPSTDFHRAIEMGYLQVNQQRAVKTSDWLKAGGRSFHEFAPRLMHSMEKAGCIKLVKKPVERYRFEFHEDILKATASVGELFLEERIALLAASRDLLTSPEQILDFEITNGVSFRDIFQVTRMIQFIRSIAAAKLIPELIERPHIVLQSIVPAFEHGQLVELLSKCVNKESASRIVSMWTTDIKSHVDIQYRPILQAGTALLLPSNILANSNMYRNPLQVIRKRMYEDGKVDPLSAMLDAKFISKGYATARGFIYKLGEIDLMVLIDNLLFAFECKNSLLPTGAHELMTSLDYIRTAADQLERFKKHFNTNTFREDIRNKTGLQITNSTQLSTAIVMSNRMFMGYRENGHPVRGAYELEHFVDEGIVAMGDETHKYWQSDQLSGNDLKLYLDNDLTYIDQWECMKDYSTSYEFRECRILVDHMYFDSLAYADKLGFIKAKAELLKQDMFYNKFVRNFSMVDEYRLKIRDVELKEARTQRKKRKRAFELKIKQLRERKKK